MNICWETANLIHGVEAHVYLDLILTCRGKVFVLLLHQTKFLVAD